MPDWSYQTLFRPLLFRMPGRLARSITLGAIGTLSRIPGGSFVIRTLGHMEPSPLLQSEAAGIDFCTPVGLSGTVDPSGTAHQAMAQFGFGFMEVGPVTVEPVISHAPLQIDLEQKRIRYPSYYENAGLASAASKLEKPGHSLPQFVRLTPMPQSSPEQAQEQLLRMIHTLHAAGAAGFYIDVIQHIFRPHDTIKLISQIENRLKEAYIGTPFFLYVPHDYDNPTLRKVIAGMDLSFWSGVLIGESRNDDDSFQVSRGDRAEVVEKIKQIRPLIPDKWILKASGVYEPQDALDLMTAGAGFVMLHDGLVFAGPGLPKRVNDAILHTRLRHAPSPKPASFWSGWGFMCLLGLGMILGGFMAWIIAATTVLLPYDFAHLGLTMDELGRINDRLAHFMSHDRITLAGTMISIGILYFQLARHGLKDGLHWSRTALMVSGSVGFSSFFLYLGYGYFDPLHALSAAILLPMFVISMQKHRDAPFSKPVNLHNDRTWRLAMYGQFCLVVLGFALAIGGLVIAAVGVTNVFVPEDLAFLGMTADQIGSIDPDLIPLIAHDRAGFGGALFSDALAVLIMALWGIQQGERWMWWTFLLGGAPAFIGALSVHWQIGYKDLWHLSPAFFALLLYILGLTLLYPYLMRKAEAPFTR